MAGPARRIAYLAQVFPLLTETFVYREVLGLRARGLEVHPYAFRRPYPEHLSRESAHLAADTVYVLPLRPLAFLAAHLACFRRRPLAYLSTLLLFCAGRRMRLKERILNLVHFLGGLALTTDMRRKGIEHIHAHFAINAATMALALSRVTGVSFSFTAHNLLFAGANLLPAKVAEAEFVCAISRHTADFLAQRAGKERTRTKIRIVRCGVPLEAFPPRRRQPPGEPPEMLFLAQLAPRKGAFYLVEACRVLANRGASFRCTILGGGPEGKRLERLVFDYGLHDRIRMCGPKPQEEIRSYLEQTQLFVLPCVAAPGGDLDGIPVVLMEAMAMGIPVLSTPVSGIPELIEDGLTGVLVAPGDGVALADAAAELLADREKRDRLGQAGRRKVAREFSLAASLDRLMALFGDPNRFPGGRKVRVPIPD